MSLYVNEAGATGRPTIVFLHGVGASGWMWEFQIAALADFHCLNVDLPGHGKSSHVEWVSLADTAHSIAMLIRSYATGGQSHVVGLSLGGYVALVLMERHPELVDRSVISGVTVEPMPNRALARPQVMLMSLMKRRWVAKMQARLLGLSPKMQDAFVENLAAMSMKSYGRIIREVANFHLPPSLHEVETPTLVVAGGRETEIIREAVFTIASMMPNAEGRFAPNLGHSWNVQDPGLFTAMTRAWLTGTALPRQLQSLAVGSN